MATVDHIMFAAADLESGMTEIADLTGVRPTVGGRHPGIGTRNALLSLGDSQYLEVIAPDPEQELEGSLGEELIAHGGSGVRGWAVASNDLLSVRQIAVDQGLAPQSIFEVNRTTPDGVYLEWGLLFVSADRRFPFFIDWKKSPHPARHAPTGCSLSTFTVFTKDRAAYERGMSVLGVNVDVEEGEPALIARLESPSGDVELTSW